MMEIDIIITLARSTLQRMLCTMIALVRHQEATVQEMEESILIQYPSLLYEKLPL